MLPQAESCANCHFWHFFENAQTQGGYMLSQAESCANCHFWYFFKNAQSQGGGGAALAEFRQVKLELGRAAGFKAKCRRSNRQLF